MAVIEYMNHAAGVNSIRPPLWLTAGGWFPDPVNKTYMGYVKDDRDFYLPDSVTVLTKAEALTRALNIHATNPFTKLPPDGVAADGSLIPLTDAEIEEQINAIWTSIANGEHG